MDVLTQPQIFQFLETTNADWTYEQGTLETTFEFSDFLEALGFVNDLGELAEQAGHHPKITIDYNEVTISLTTHDADNQITSLDTALIRQIEELVE